MSGEPGGGVARLVEMVRDPARPLHEQQAAFARLVERSQRAVLGLAASLLGDADEAKDAAQEAFLTAWVRLAQLRDGAAFEGWLRTIVATACRRRLRRWARETPLLGESPACTGADTSPLDYRSVVQAALAALPTGERQVAVLYYVEGYTQEEIARRLGLKPGTVAKRLHSARLRVRRRLPPSVRSEFLRVTPSRSFTEQVRRGLLDQFVGEYRFRERPELVVSIVREGDALVSECGCQRNVLASLDDASLVTSHYDGEGRFGRNGRGEVTHFVYYEFGKRLGVAWKSRVAPFMTS